MSVSINYNNKLFSLEFDHSGTIDTLKQLLQIEVLFKEDWLTSINHSTLLPKLASPRLIDSFLL